MAGKAQGVGKEGRENSPSSTCLSPKPAVYEKYCQLQLQRSGQITERTALSGAENSMRINDIGKEDEKTREGSRSSWMDPVESCTR